MANLTFADTLTTLQVERKRLRKNLVALDKAVAVLRSLSSANHQPSRNGMKRVLSAAGRRKIAAAQRKRWAKVRAARRSKT